MNIILLSGGSGKRLWPLSNEERAKQFIKIFKDEHGCYESMVQRMFRQIKNVDPEAKITIATSATQVSALQEQLGKGVGISVEPCRRDTFPAIALSAAYLHDVQRVKENEQVVVCPVNPYVEADYFYAIKELHEESEKSCANLMLMGITPDHPSEKYGYILPESNAHISRVKTFKEKPNEEMARKYLACGALWNAGVFAFQLSYVLNICEDIFGTSDYDELYENYANLERISFDYAVVEKESVIEVMRFSGKWNDLGTWDALSDAMQENCIGNDIVMDKCEDTYVMNELDVPVICCGLKDVIVSITKDGILISDRKQASGIKNLVEIVEQDHIFPQERN